MRNIVGKKVSEARENAKPPLTQEQLIARLESNGWKISRGSLAKIEVGIRSVTDIELVALANALRVPPEALLDIGLFETLHQIHPRGKITKIQ